MIKIPNLLRFCLEVQNLFLIFAAKSQYIGIMTQQDIGRAIKERRKKLRVNQQTLADLAGVAVNTLVAQSIHWLPSSVVREIRSYQRC